MRKILFVSLIGLVLTASLANADIVVTKWDSYGGMIQPGNTVPDPGDVIGTLKHFDIQKFEIDGAGHTIKLFFDYGGGLTSGTLDRWDANSGGTPLWMLPGDLYINSGGNEYSIALADHVTKAGVDINGRIVGPASGVNQIEFFTTKTNMIYKNPVWANARQTLWAINYPPAYDPGAYGEHWYYRPDAPAQVWRAGNSTNSDEFSSKVSVVTALFAPGPTTYVTTITIDPTVWTNMGLDNKMDLGWSSTSCSNDFYRTGELDAVPEPSAYFVLLTGLAGIVYTVRRRRLNS